MAEDVEKTETCAHPPCKCTAPMEADYCSEYCENATSGIDTRCHCGHPECC